MSEDIPICRIHEKYRLIECDNPPLAGDPQGFCILHSENKSKDPVTFREALLSRWEQADANLLDFRGVYFPIRFNWRDYFGTKVFEKPMNFSWACFSEEAIFSWAIFKENASFLRANFIGEAHFYRALFERRANFSGVQFKGEADFYGANFVEPADFRRVRINGQMLFKGGYEPERLPAPRLVFPQWGDFRFLQFGPEAVLRFQDLSLERVEFAGNDLCRVEFHHVRWHPYNGRQAIYDEVLLRQAEKENPWYWPWFWTWISCRLHLRFFALESGTQLPQYLEEEFPPPDLPLETDKYGEVERLYRNLKLNYEKVGDFKNAGDFHYGEMEMHRRASKWRWFAFYWYNIYRLLSGYGERPSWALGWLAVFLAVLTSLLAWTGLEILDSKHSAGFGNSFFFLLQKVTLQRPIWAEPQGFFGKLVAGLSVLLIPGQAALFLLALRNRLGRRR